ncbi:SubName: Full=Uncharacterized protein {ECO:0000313/EMBL:CCA76921.1} [Serendipita indica DSM 11827]|nr:SubName: Full=Uncharacterized protein {ECO:0000313/EMBL:CCA76921.1} [Serendipita indica DSM 11827]
MSTEAIDRAVSFLTTPLSHMISPARCSSGSKSPLDDTFEIHLRLASSTPPPECIVGACEASGVDWCKWRFLLGGGMGLDLDVTIRHDAVTAGFSRAATPSLGRVTIWQESQPETKIDADDEDLFNEISDSQQSTSMLLYKRMDQGLAASQWLSLARTGSRPFMQSDSGHSPTSSILYRASSRHASPSSDPTILRNNAQTRHAAAQPTSLPRHLALTGGRNRPRSHSVTESDYSVASPMLYITSSQCASPSFGPVIVDD